MRFRANQTWMAVAAVVLSLSGCGAWKNVGMQIKGDQIKGDGKNDDDGIGVPNSWYASDGMTFFADCTEVKRFLAYSGRAIPKGGVSADASPSIIGNTVYDIQESGVEEPDPYGINAHHIFVTRPQDVLVLDRATGSEIGSLTFTDAQSGGEVLLSGEKVIVFEKGKGTTVRIYKDSVAGLPVLEREIVLSGSFSQARLVGSRVILLTSDLIKKDDIGLTHIDHGKAVDRSHLGMACNRILRPVDVRPGWISYLDVTALYGIDIENSEVAVQSLGWPSHLTSYINQDQVVMMQSVYDSDAVIMIDPAPARYAITHVSQVALGRNTDPWQVRAVGRIPGSVKDRWRVKATGIDGPMFLATGNGQKNYLLALSAHGKSLDIESHLDTIGPGETIRAVRYTDNTAYIVTYLQTDPVYAIDIGNAKSLKILDMLKVPGFSSALYPVSSTQMIGVGSAMDEGATRSVRKGFQISVFDKSDRTHIVRSDVKEFLGSSFYSAAEGEHHAFYFKDGIMGVPYSNTTYAADYTVDKYERGALFYQLNGGTLSEIRNVNHDGLTAKDCLTISEGISRIIAVDGKILTLSSYGAKWLSPVDASELSSQQFSNADKTCEMYLTKHRRVGWCGVGR